MFPPWFGLSGLSGLSGLFGLSGLSGLFRLFRLFGLYGQPGHSSFSRLQRDLRFAPTSLLASQLLPLSFVLKFSVFSASLCEISLLFFPHGSSIEQGACRYWLFGKKNEDNLFYSLFQYVRQY